MVDQVGRVLGGRYRLVAPIGSGASAQVFLADDVTLRRRVAVKVLHPALADDEAFLRRFRAEARSAAALSHPHLVAVYDWGKDGGPFLVLEYLGGGSLAAMLDRGARLTVAQALLVGLEAVRGLDFAHRRGFVHRDIKPGNLLFDEEGRLRIADFGLARALAESAWTEPTGDFVGSARYASPEQAQGRPVDGASDLYSLGLVLIEAVTGKVPFAADTSIATLMARVGAEVPVPDAMGPLAPLLAEVGRPDPDARPDAATVGRRLVAIARDLDAPAPLPLARAVDLSALRDLADPEPTKLPAAPPPAGGRDGSEGEAVDPEPAGGPAGAPAGAGEASRRRRRAAGPGRRTRRLVVGAAVALVLVAAGIAGALALAPDPPPEHAMPSLVGMSSIEARDALARIGVRPAAPDTRHVEGTASGLVIDQDPSAGTMVAEGSTASFVVSLGPPPVEVPSLESLHQDQVAAVLEGARLVLGAVEPVHHEDVGAGIVLTWRYGARERPERAPSGSAIDVVVSAGPAPRTVPALAGERWEDAAQALRDLGLVAERDDAFHDAVEAGQVITTRPGAGQQVERGSAVTVVVSRGPDLVTVPDLAGRSLAEATRILEQAGLERGDVFGRGERVFDSDPRAGARVRRGTAIDLYVRR